MDKQKIGVLIILFIMFFTSGFFASKLSTDCNDDNITCENGIILTRDSNNFCRFPECEDEVCSADPLICPDGSIISRSYPNCTYSNCILPLENKVILGGVDDVLSNHPWSYKNHSISDDLLSIYLIYSGGCQNHIFNIAWDGTYQENRTAIINLYHFDGGDVCTDLVETTREFDISLLNEALEIFLIDYDNNRYKLIS